ALLGQQHHLPHQLFDEVPFAVGDVVVFRRHDRDAAGDRHLFLGRDELGDGEIEHGWGRSVPQVVPSWPAVIPPPWRRANGVSGPSRTASRTGKRPPTGGHHVR